MYKTEHNGRADEDSPFIKGMTLEQYMAHSNFNSVPADSLDESLEENLFESSHYGRRETLQSKKKHYRIDEIDEESAEDSKDYPNHNDTLETPGFEIPERQDSIRSHIEVGRSNKARTNSVSLSTAVTFKNTYQDPNNFRVKRLSVSPQKKKAELPAAFPNGSITLYGSKFGQAPLKPQKQPEMQMLTFYGKLHL
jgi:hypothetical protein